MPGNESSPSSKGDARFALVGWTVGCVAAARRVAAWDTPSDDAREEVVFQYICERIIPGCGHQDRDKSRDELMQRVEVHLREHHDLDHHDDRISEALKTTGINFIHPA
jgi:predicted small metal-binding protein